MTIPGYLRPFYKVIKEKKGINYYIAGELSCCRNATFSISYNGQLHQNIFGNKYFLSAGKRIILTAQCSECSGKIHIFDECSDGYDNCINVNNKKNVDEVMRPLWCDKCNHNTYRIMVSYEYPDFEELEKLDTRNKENSFTWIKVSLRCTECHKVYKNIIDFETG